MTRSLYTRLLIAAAAMMLFTGWSAAGEVSLPEVLSGKVAPLTITFGEMAAGWSQFSLTPANWLDAFIFRDNGEEPAMLRRFSDCYTRGEMLSCGGETFLVAYRRPNPYEPLFRAGLQLQGMDDAMPDFDVARLFITRDTRFSLCLLHMKELGNLMDIRPVDAQAELDAAAKMLIIAQEKAQRTKSTNNLRQLVLSLIMYAQENDERLPGMADKAAFWAALSVPEAFTRHPVTKELYRYNSALSGKALGTIKKPTDTPAFYEGSAWADGSRMIAYLDGHVSQVNAAEWAKMKANWKLP